MDKIQLIIRNSWLRAAVSIVYAALVYVFVIKLDDITRIKEYREYSSLILIFSFVIIGVSFYTFVRVILSNSIRKGFSDSRKTFVYFFDFAVMIALFSLPLAIHYHFLTAIIGVALSIGYIRIVMVRRI
jgi:hypothetical protein